jgi:hypothetical protein
MSVQMSLARPYQEPQSSNITYFYDSCELIQLGLDELSLESEALEIGLIMRRIVDDKRMSFAKIIDPIVTRRLQSAFFSGKKFRRMSLLIQSSLRGHNVRFEDVNVTRMKQKLESGIITDIVTITFNYGELDGR